MAKLSTEDLLGQFKEMTLVELSDFVKSFEEEFDVKASAPVAVAAAPAGAAAAPKKDEGKAKEEAKKSEEAAAAGLGALFG